MLASVKPQQGLALLFTQDLLHDGAVIKSGTDIFLSTTAKTHHTGVKYILRTEVLYRRVRSVLDRAPSVLAASEDLQRITAAYKASCEAEERGAAPSYTTSLLHLCFTHSLTYCTNRGLFTLVQAIRTSSSSTWWLSNCRLSARRLLRSFPYLTMVSYVFRSRAIVFVLSIYLTWKALRLFSRFRKLECPFVVVVYREPQS